jgi:hypothetical protein
MKATIYHDGNSPKAFYVGLKIVSVGAGEKLEGDYDDGLLIALKKTGFTVEHKGDLKAPDLKVDLKSTKAAKSEAEKIIADAKSEAEEILKAAKEAADKIIIEAEELAKAK